MITNADLPRLKVHQPLGLLSFANTAVHEAILSFHFPVFHCATYRTQILQTKGYFPSTR